MNAVYLASFAVKCYKVTCVNELLHMFPHYESASFLLPSQSAQIGGKKWNHMINHMIKQIKPYASKKVFVNICKGIRNYYNVKIISQFYTAINFFCMFYYY